MTNPVEVHHHASVGMAILLSGSFAFFAAYYAVQVVGATDLVAVTVAVLWALMIMNLDRLLVSSSALGPSSTLERALLKRYVGPLFLRLPLAIALGYTIAIPIELRIFRSEIDDLLGGRALGALTEEGRKKDAEARAQGDERRRELEADLGRIDKRILDLEDELRNTMSARQEIEANPLVVPSLTTDTNGDLQRSTKRLRRPEYAVADQREQVLKEQIERSRQSQVAARDALAMLISGFERAAIQRREQQAAQARDIVERRFGFATRFEALGRIKAESPPQRQLSWFIRLMFVLIEAFPVLTKVLVSASGYEKRSAHGAPGPAAYG